MIWFGFLGRLGVNYSNYLNIGSRLLKHIVFTFCEFLKMFGGGKAMKDMKGTLT